MIMNKWKNFPREKFPIPHKKPNQLARTKRNYKIISVKIKEMVSLSSNEMLKQMAENYGYGSYLFSQLSLEQLIKLEQIDPEFNKYLDYLFSGEISDPEALQILETKYNNDLMLHKPNVYEYDISDKQIQKLSSKDDIDFLQQELATLANKIAAKIDERLRIGDVILIKGNGLHSYYMLQNINRLQNVYFQLNKLEIVDPIRYMNILGSTPVNYWNEIGIPSLQFEFDLQIVFEKISWGKVKVQNKNYLVGEFVYQKKKVFLIVPIEGKMPKASADKIALSLQINSRKAFETKDPNGIIPDDPVVFFANLENNIISTLLPIAEEREEQEEQEEQEEHMADIGDL